MSKSQLGQSFAATDPKKLYTHHNSLKSPVASSFLPSCDATPPLPSRPEVQKTDASRGSDNIHHQSGGWCRKVVGGGGATAASGMRIRRFGGIRIAMAGRQAGGRVDSAQGRGAEGRKECGRSRSRSEEDIPRCQSGS